MKYIFTFLTILFLSCTNSHEKSFLKLNDAFVRWYHFNNPSQNITFNKKDDYIKYYRYYDQISIDEYLEDLNRFSLELSQIKLSDLNKNHRIDYLSILEKIDQIYFEINILKKHENQPSLYIDKIKFLIQNIYNNKKIELNDKLNLLSDVFDHSFKYIGHSKKILKLNSNNDSLENKISNFNSELDIICNEILFYYNNLREIYNENKEESFIKKYHSLQDTLNNYKTWINSNLTSFDNVEVYNKQNIYNYYNKNEDLYKKNSIQINVENKLIVDRMFQASLDIYLKENDEPVWVDIQDTLNVVSWVIDNHININQYSKDDFINKIETYLNKQSLKSDSIKYQGNNDIFINNILSNCEFYNDYYLDYYIKNKIIENYVAEVIKKFKVDTFEPKFLFINEFYIDALIDLIELNNYKNNINNNIMDGKILFYLKLYRDNIKIQYQEQYYNNIGNKIIFKKNDNDILFKNINKNMIIKEVTDPENYILLKNIYKNKIHHILQYNNIDINNIDESIKILIINRYDKN